MADIRLRWKLHHWLYVFTIIGLGAYILFSDTDRQTEDGADLPELGSNRAAVPDDGYTHVPVQLDMTNYNLEGPYRLLGLAATTAEGAVVAWLQTPSGRLPYVMAGVRFAFADASTAEFTRRAEAALTAWETAQTKASEFPLADAVAATIAGMTAPTGDGPVLPPQQGQLFVENLNRREGQLPVRTVNLILLGEGVVRVDDTATGVSEWDLAGYVIKEREARSYGRGFWVNEPQTHPGE